MHIILIRNTYFAAIALVVLGIVFMCTASNKRVWVDMESTDYNSVLIDQVTTDMVLEGELYANYGAFVESYSVKNGAKYGKSYFTYFGDADLDDADINDADINDNDSNKSTFSFRLNDDEWS